jgi:hypothetical protein
VKCYLIDPKLLAECGKDADQRFANGSGADDVNDFLLCHSVALPVFKLT